MTRWIRPSVIGITMLFGLSLTAVPAPAQSGAFDKLTPGNQKIARALFEAQKPGTPRPLSLDDIATRKLKGGKGWNDIFKDMRSRGPMEERSLGQVVSNYEKQHPGPEPGRKRLKGEGLSRPDVLGKPARPREQGADPAMPGKALGHAPGGGLGLGGGKGK